MSGLRRYSVHPRNQKGFGYLFAMIFMIIFAGLAFFIISASSTDFQIARNDLYEKTAYYAAEYGITLGRDAVGSNIADWSRILDGSLCTSSNHQIPTDLDDPLQMRGTVMKGAVVCHPVLGELWGVKVGQASTSTKGTDLPPARVNVFLRNDMNDPSGSPVVDQNQLVWLIAEGYVQVGNRVLARKVISVLLGLCSRPGDIHNTSSIYLGLCE